MCAVNFYDVKASLYRASRSVCERLHDALYSFFRKFLGNDRVVGVGDSTGTDDVVRPTTELLCRERSLREP